MQKYSQGKQYEPSVQSSSRSKVNQAKSPVPDLSYSSLSLSPNPVSVKGFFSPQSINSLDLSSFPDRQKPVSSVPYTQSSVRRLNFNNKAEDKEKKYMQEYIDVLKNRIKILTSSPNTQVFINDEELLKLRITNSKLELELEDQQRRILALQEENTQQSEENLKIFEKIRGLENRSEEIIEKNEGFRSFAVNEDAFIKLKLEKVEMIEKMSEMKKEILHLREKTKIRHNEALIFSVKNVKSQFEDQASKAEEYFEKELEKIRMQTDRLETRLDLSRRTVRFLQQNSLKENFKNKNLEKEIQEKSENFSKIITSRSQLLEGQSEKLSSYEQELRSLKTSLQSKQDKIEKLNEENFQNSLTIEEQKAQFSRISDNKNSEIESLKQSIEQLKENSLKTEEKTRSFDEVVLEKNKEILRLSGIIDGQRHELLLKNEEIEMKIHKVKSLEADTKVFEVRIMHLEDQMRDFIKEKSQVQQTLDEKDKIISELKSSFLDQSRKLSESSVTVTKTKEKLQNALNLLKDKEKDLEKSGKFLETCQEQLTKKKGRIEVLEKKLKDAELVLLQEKQKISVLRSEEDQFKENQIKALTENFEKIVEKKEKLIQSLNEKLAESEFEVEKMKGEVEGSGNYREEELEKLLERVEGEKRNLEKEVLDRDQVIKRLEDENELLSENIEKAKAEAEVIRHEKDMLIKDLRIVSTEKSELTIKLDEIQGLAKQKSLKIENLNKDLQALTHSKAALETKLAKHQAEHTQENTELENLIKKLNSELEAKEKDLSEINQLKPQFNTEISQLKSKISESEKTYLHQISLKEDSYNSEKQRLGNLIKSLENKINQIEIENQVKEERFSNEKKKILSELETERNLNQSFIIKLEGLNKNKEELEENLRLLIKVQEQLEKETQDHEKTKNFLEVTLEKLEQGTENYTQASQLFAQIKAKMEENLEKSEENNEKLSKDLESVQKINKALETSLQKLKIDMKNSELLQISLEETIKSYEDSNSMLQSKLDDTELNNADLEKRLSDLQQTFKDQESTVSSHLNQAILLLTKQLNIKPPDLEARSELSIKALYIISLSEKLESSLTQSAKTSETIKEKDLKIKELNKSLTLLNQELNVLKQNVEKNKKIIEKKNTGIEKQESEIESLKSENSKLRSDNFDSEEIIKDLTENLENSEKSLKELKATTEEENSSLANKLKNIESIYKANEEKLKAELKTVNQALLKSQTTVNTIESNLRESLAKISSTQFLIQELQQKTKAQELEIISLKSQKDQSAHPESSDSIIKLESEIESYKKIIDSLTNGLNIPDKPHLTEIASNLSESYKMITSLTTLNYNSVDGRKEIFRQRDLSKAHLSIISSLQEYLNSLLNT